MNFPRNPALVLASAALVFSAQAIADHNSKWGEGWANMPNDVHNTRIDTRASGDNEAFKDFVQYGNGAESVNRYDDGEDGGNRQMKQAGPVAEAAAEKDPLRDQDRTKDQVRDRSRDHQASASGAQQGEMLQTRQNLRTRQSTQVRQSLGTGAGQGGARRGGRGGH